MEPKGRRTLSDQLDGKATLAAALALAAGTQAYAVPVRHENPAGPDHYQWDSFLSNILDIRFGPAGQSGALVDGVSASASYSYSFFDDPYSPYQFGSSRSTISGGASFLEGGYPYGGLTAGVTQGAYIGGGGPFASPSTLSYIDFDNHGGGTRLYSNLVSGLEYLGLRLMVDTGTRALEVHYGWIAVNIETWTPPVSGSIPMQLITDAVAWGWETEPNTRIAAGAPSPGSLGALAFGAVVFGGRGGRRRATDSSAP